GPHPLENLKSEGARCKDGPNSHIALAEGLDVGRYARRPYIRLLFRPHGQNGHIAHKWRGVFQQIGDDGLDVLALELICEPPGDATPDVFLPVYRQPTVTAREVFY